MKKCYRCKKEKEVYLFSKDKYQKDGYTFDCKECRRKIYKEWYDNNPDKVKESIAKTVEYRRAYYSLPENKKRLNLKRIEREFGISIESYLKLEKKQNGLCAICGENELSKRNKNLSLDHCHITNKIRGLLCTNCNRAIGLLKDDVFILKKAIKYLLKHKK